MNRALFLNITDVGQGSAISGIVLFRISFRILDWDSGKKFWNLNGRPSVDITAAVYMRRDRWRKGDFLKKRKFGLKDSEKSK